MIVCWTADFYIIYVRPRDCLISFLMQVSPWIYVKYGLFLFPDPQLLERAVRSARHGSKRPHQRQSEAISSVHLIRLKLFVNCPIHLSSFILSRLFLWSFFTCCCTGRWKKQGAQWEGVAGRMDNLKNTCPLFITELTGWGLQKARYKGSTHWLLGIEQAWFRTPGQMSQLIDVRKKSIPRDPTHQCHGRWDQRHKFQRVYKPVRVRHVWGKCAIRQFPLSVIRPAHGDLGDYYLVWDGKVILPEPVTQSVLGKAKKANVKWTSIKLTHQQAQQLMELPAWSGKGYSALHRDPVSVKLGKRR